MENIGPRTLPAKYVCVGCPALKTEYWRDEVDNDHWDSGTIAICTAKRDSVDSEGRTISSYWHENYPPPDWCPALKPIDKVTLIGDRGLHSQALRGKIMRQVKIVGQHKSFDCEIELVEVPTERGGKFSFSPIGDPYLCLCYDDKELRQLYEILKAHFGDSPCVPK